MLKRQFFIIPSRCVTIAPQASNATGLRRITLLRMKRYRLVYRGVRNTYYSLDTHLNKRESLGTGNKDEAQRVIDARTKPLFTSA